MRYLILIALLGLQGCGFTPVYGEKLTERYGGTLPVIAIDVQRGHPEQVLKIALEDRLNPGGQIIGAPDYTLKITLITTPQPVVIEGNATVQRYNMQVDAEFTLTRIADGKKVFGGKARRVGSYNSSRAFFAAYTASQDAAQRTIEELAADIDMRLHAFLLSPPVDYAPAAQPSLPDPKLFETKRKTP